MIKRSWFIAVQIKRGRGDHIYSHRVFTTRTWFPRVVEVFNYGQSMIAGETGTNVEDQRVTTFNRV